jgi:hypothetical protein
MTEYISVITKEGKNHLWQTGFSGGSGELFSYGMCGIGLIAPTETSTGLNAECVDETYSRPPLTNTFDEETKTVTSEFTLTESNIGVEPESAVVITEIGITDISSGDGTCFCVCQIAPTSKDASKSLKFVIVSQFE